MTIISTLLLTKSSLLNGRYRIRICDPLIKIQLSNNDKNIHNRDLHKTHFTAYKPAYKENQKTAKKQDKIDTSEMPPNLEEIVQCWPTLPDAIRSAIPAIVRNANEQ